MQNCYVPILRVAVRLILKQRLNEIPKLRKCRYLSILSMESYAYIYCEKASFFTLYHHHC